MNAEMIWAEEGPALELRHNLTGSAIDTTHANTLRGLVETIDAGEQLRVRVVQDAITNALGWQLRRRADLFLAAAPRPEDFNGQATEADLAAARDRCRGVAVALRSRATAIEAGWLAC
jgi:hypothetical protein